MRIDFRICLAGAIGMLAGWVISQAWLSSRIQELDSEIHVLRAAVHSQLARQTRADRTQVIPPGTPDHGGSGPSNGLPETVHGNQPVQILDLDSKPDPTPDVMAIDPGSVRSDD